MYMATRPIQVGDETRQYGDEVPEAESWPNLEAYLNHGWIRRVDALPAKATPAAEDEPDNEGTDAETADSTTAEGDTVPATAPKRTAPSSPRAGALQRKPAAAKSDAATALSERLGQ